MMSIKTGEIRAKDDDLDDAGTFPVDGVVASASADDYDALVLPGGTINPRSAPGRPRARTAVDRDDPSRGWGGLR